MNQKANLTCSWLRWYCLVFLLMAMSLVAERSLAMEGVLLISFARLSESLHNQDSDGTINYAIIYQSVIR